eukprot:TRINITY_DN6812_c0_g2_i3.p2 TRINITY_DN6812_c0_g2~~TRINITY_DN6812_c0_g2_i3.p2  ORF type:complete len:242 (+),score=46.60 TRINITY_DN6812_c0_g2_i3:313-1038(+)
MSEVGLVPEPEAGGACCWTFAPCAGWRVIVLDSFAFSVMSQPGAEHKAEAAREWLDAADAPSLESWPPQREVGDLARRWSDGGGAFGEKQLRWLETQLEECALRSEKVVLVGHEPVHPRVVNDYNGLAWDFDQVLATIQRHSAVIWVYLAGHDHEGGMVTDDAQRVLHLTVPAPLQALPGTNRWLAIRFFGDRIEFIGEGKVRVAPGDSLIPGSIPEEEWVLMQQTPYVWHKQPSKISTKL